MAKEIKETKEVKKDDYHTKRNRNEWIAYFSNEGNREAIAQLTGNLMIAVGYYHDRMKLHILLHPFFYVAGFLTAYWWLN
jgi:hypothetical protein